MSSLATGARIEDSACNYLQANNLAIIARNFKCKVGEIDLIARDQEDLVFVEVRYRKNTNFGSAAETVNVYKQRKVIRAAQIFLQVNQWAQQQYCRFDVLALSGSIDTPQIEWIKDAFNE